MSFKKVYLSFFNVLGIEYTQGFGNHPRTRVPSETFL